MKRKKKTKKKKLKVSVKEIELLEKGHIPKKSKIGSKFKGKNKTIVA